MNFVHPSNSVTLSMTPNLNWSLMIELYFQSTSGSLFDPLIWPLKCDRLFTQKSAIMVKSENSKIWIVTYNSSDSPIILILQFLHDSLIFPIIWFFRLLFFFPILWVMRDSPIFPIIQFFRFFWFSDFSDYTILPIFPILRVLCDSPIFPIRWFFSVLILRIYAVKVNLNLLNVYFSTW